MYGGRTDVDVDVDVDVDGARRARALRAGSARAEGSSLEGIAGLGR